MSRRLEAFEIWAYRRIIRISWAKKINKDVLTKMKIKIVLYRTIKTKKLKFFEHIIRHNNLHRNLLEGKVNSKRGRGKPRTNWMTNIISGILGGGQGPRKSKFVGIFQLTCKANLQGAGFNPLKPPGSATAGIMPLKIASALCNEQWDFSGRPSAAIS